MEKYFKFDGVATRSEYWGVMIIATLLAFVFGLFGGFALGFGGSAGSVLGTIFGGLVLLATIVAVSVLAGEKLSGLALGWVGISSIALLIVYLVGIRQLFRAENSDQPSPEASPPQYKEIPARKIYLRFALAAAAIIGTGIWISFIGDEIAETYSWSASFVGSSFLAVSTSLPELVVAIAALRLGAIDMAVADILGANMLDIAYIFIIDLFSTTGPVLSLISNSHLITTGVVGAMNLLVILGLRFRQKRKVFISWYALALIGLYIFGAYALFISGLG